MATISLTPRLRTEYTDLFKSCVIAGERKRDVDTAVNRLIVNRPRYQAVADATGVPWPVIAVIHCLEASLDFRCHLHNGDPLTARTVQVPANRPAAGEPPFTWEASAADALAWERLHLVKDWSLPAMLFRLEKYNGLGYRRHHPDVLSPYLWSYSQHYTKGKFVADGTWSPTAVSKQCGAAVLLRRLAERGEVVFADEPSPQHDEQPMVVFSTRRPSDPAAVERARALQRWLNTLPGIFVLVDGIPGRRTSDAFRKVTGRYLEGDPRGNTRRGRGWTRGHRASGIGVRS